MFDAHYSCVGILRTRHSWQTWYALLGDTRRQGIEDDVLQLGHFRRVCFLWVCGDLVIKLSSCGQQKNLALWFRGDSQWSSCISPTLSHQSYTLPSHLVKSASHGALKTWASKMSAKTVCQGTLEIRPPKDTLVRYKGLRSGTIGRFSVGAFQNSDSLNFPSPISSTLGC